MPIIVKDLEHTYMEGTPFANKVLHGVSMTVNDGELLGLIGPSRSGKSTLIQYFNGLFIPEKGQVAVDSVDTRENRRNLKPLRQKVGLVFQYPEHQLFEETVSKDVGFGPRNLGLGEKEIIRRVWNSLEAVGMEPKTYWNRYTFALSGGQKRRVAIAGVLAMQPKILVLDDPTAGLDPRGREEILRVVQGLHRDLGVTIVFISNNMEDIARLAQRVVCLAEGKVLLEGEPAEVFTQVELLQSMGLGILPTISIMRKLHDRGLNVPLNTLSVEETVEALIVSGVVRRREKQYGAV
ncbi:MAG: energy-coupling factor transporter ATPase [Desulfitobacteriaceae bacterium]